MIPFPFDRYDLLMAVFYSVSDMSEWRIEWVCSEIHLQTKIKRRWITQFRWSISEFEEKITQCIWRDEGVYWIDIDSLKSL